ncbi:hypothetical protein C2G38_2144173 [Gigaspora rosea]|uniref:Uncharacterized protein n=1 Tax=Gigaspora rosea TaxID=44941 RepID=A0A397UX71_9GLOM|nr:hypothetical protein C2G38_2144173 [Gigaspora rosea]
MVKEAHITVESFAHSNRFGIRKERVKKDANGHEISRSFLCRHAGKPSTKNRSHNTDESGSCHTNCNWKIQDDDIVFIDNAFDYPLAHSFTRFKQVESNVAEIWEVRRGRPPKVACYQSSFENQTLKAQGKQPKLTCSPGTNTCGECGGKGHNCR